MSDKKTILIADDERGILDLLIAMFSHDFDVVPVANGAEAYALLSEHPGRFSMAILDERMPGYPGTAVIELLRARQIDIPVILLSGHWLYGDDPLPSGTLFMRKPFKAAELRTAGHNAVKGCLC